MQYAQEKAPISQQRQGDGVGGVVKGSQLTEVDHDAIVDAYSYSQGCHFFSDFKVMPVRLKSNYHTMSQNSEEGLPKWAWIILFLLLFLLFECGGK